MALTCGAEGSGPYLGEGREMKLVEIYERLERKYRVAASQPWWPVPADPEFAPW